MQTFTFHFETVVGLKAKKSVKAKSFTNAKRNLRRQMNKNAIEFLENLDFEYQGQEGEILPPYLYGIERSDNEWEVFNPFNALLQEYVDRYSKKDPFAMQEKFDFLPQSASINTLLNACIAALPSLPKQEQNNLVAAMHEFEGCGKKTKKSKTA